MKRAILLLAFLSSTMWSQQFRSTITGRVIDPQGAAIPEVRIIATQSETGTHYDTVSSSNGQYTLAFLAPGTYQVEATVSGFRRYLHKDVVLGANERIGLEIQMELGQTTESITVTTETPVLNTASASIGQVINDRQVSTMPLNGRTPLVLAQLAYGVLATGPPSYVRPFDNAGPSSISMGGAPSQTNELLLDGAPDTNNKTQVAYNPPMEAVQQVKVESFQSDAAYGYTGGGTADVILKSGTNALHGSAYEFNQVSRLAATPFFTNAAGLVKQNAIFNQWGINAGGPIIMPKFYDGRNRLFFFFAYEGVHDVLPNPATSTVPTAAERQGDFSTLLNVSNSYQIYDPLTGQKNGSRISRSPFPGNIIPVSRLSPIAQNYLNLYPLPNQAGRADGANNFLSNTNGEVNWFNNEIGRLDWNASDRQKIYFSFRHNERISNGDNVLGRSTTDITATNGGRRTNFGTTLDDVVTLSPTMFLDTRANWTRYTSASIVYSNGFDMTGFGFPSSLAAASQQHILPAVSFTSFTGVGQDSGSNSPFDSFQIFTTLSRAMGKHSLKTGADLRLMRYSSFGYGYSSGSYSFGTNWTNGPLDNSAAAPIGQDLAAFLLGMPTGGEFDINSAQTSQAGYYAFFLQDDIRVKPNLTLNLGIRYERNTGATERFNRTVNGFDTSTPNSIDAAARAAYALHPIPQVSPEAFGSVGGLTFASSGNRQVYRLQSGHFSPRLGFSWQPSLLGSKTVIRGGTGVFFFPISTQSVIQTGFSQATSLVPTLDGYITPHATLANGFPDGIQTPAGSTQGVDTYLGQSISFFNPNPTNGYSVRWNLNIQRQLSSNTVLEAGYMGNHAIRMNINRSLNYVPTQYLSRSGARDQATINLLTSNVANPFSGLLPNSKLNGSTVALSQLLMKYPQYSGVTEQYSNEGNSYFHMLQFRLEQRLAHGLQVLANYQFSKLIDRTNFLNASDYQPEKRIASDDRPHRFVTSASYDLPFGTGKAFGEQTPRAVRWLIGGWVVNSIYTLQSGAPAGFGNLIYYGGDLQWNARNISHVFDTTRFNTKSSEQLANNLRTFPSQFGTLRADRVNDLDASLLKNMKLGEKLWLQYRFEAFNALNRSQFSAPSTSATSSAFGTVTSQANLPRRIQMALKLNW